MLFCQKCADIDHSKGRRRTHALLPVSEATVGQHYKYQRCRDHGEKIKAFCEDCRKSVCALCLHIGSHEGHKAVSVETAFRRTRESMRAQAEALIKERHRVESFIDDLDNLAHKVEARASRLREKLASACDGFKAILVDREAQLTTTLAETEAEKLATIARQRRRWVDISTDVARARKMADAALQENHPVAFLRMADAFEQQMHAIEMASAKRRAASATTDDFGLELDVPRISALLKEGIAFKGAAAGNAGMALASSQDNLAGRFGQLSLLASPQTQGRSLGGDSFLSPDGRLRTAGGARGADASGYGDTPGRYVDLLSETCQADYEKNGRSMTVERFTSLLRAMLQRAEGGLLRQLPAAATHGRGLRVLADNLLLDMEASGLQEASMSDNAFVFLPAACVDAAGGSLVANLTPGAATPDGLRASAVGPLLRGHSTPAPRTIWLGRMWQLQDALKARRRGSGVPSYGAFGGGASVGGEPEAVDTEVERQRAAAALRIQRSWRGQRARADNSFTVLKVFKACNLRGVVVFATSSTGLCGQDLRYCRMLAGMGYLVIVPDAMASASRAGPRLRAPRVEISPEDDDNYWEEDPLLTQIGASVRRSTSQGWGRGQGGEEGQPGARPCYLLEEPSSVHKSLPKYMAVRSAEVAYTLRGLPSFLRQWGVFLMGVGEGGMLVAHMPVTATSSGGPDSELIAGRVVCSYSWEPNCFSAALLPSSAPGGRGYSGVPAPASPYSLFEFGGALRSCPALNIVGSHDEFFGPYNSVAAAVAAGAQSPADHADRGDASAPRPLLDGHGYRTLLSGGVEAGLVAQLQGAGHDMTRTHDGALRELLVTFLSKPRRCYLLDKLWEGEPSLRALLQQPSRSGGVLFVQVKQAPLRAGSRETSRLALLDAPSTLASWQGDEASPLRSAAGSYPRNDQFLRDLSAKAVTSLRHPTGFSSPVKTSGDFGEASLRGTASLRGVAAATSQSGALFDSRRISGGTAAASPYPARATQPVSRMLDPDLQSEHAGGRLKGTEMNHGSSPLDDGVEFPSADEPASTYDVEPEQSPSHIPPHLAHLAGNELADSLDVA
eukprot:jgi/Mesvir1/12067/Mv00351-RA.2